MKKPIQYRGKDVIAIQNNTNILTLTWVINNICTNHCSYCPSYLHNGSNHNYDWEHAKSFINECFARYGNVKCSIAGGEPTVSPFYKDLISLIYDKGGAVHVSTNLVRSIEWWSDIVEKSSSIGASYHPEFVVTQDDEDEFINKIKFLSLHTATQVRVMMHPGLWDRAYNFYNRLVKEELPIYTEMVRISPNFGGGNTIFFPVNYTKEQIDILSADIPLYKGNPNLSSKYRGYPGNSVMHFSDGSIEPMYGGTSSELYNNQVLDFSGWDCKIGLESLFVGHEGSIFRGNCVVGGKLGTLSGNINWPSESIICNKRDCHCTADIEITKSQI